MKYAIEPFQYTFDEDDIEYILASFGKLLRDHQFLTMGTWGLEFEKQFVTYNNSIYATSVSSGTGALEIILRAIRVEGGKVIVPTNTYGATVVSILRAGATPIFADCASDMTISPEDVARKLSTTVRAVITVHIGGLISSHTRTLQTLCESSGIPLVEDAAHAVGSALGGKKAGSFGVAAAFSFFATKVLTCGEGGMIITEDEEMCHKARLLRDHAKSRGNRMLDTGYNWRMPEVLALMGIRQLARLDEFVSERNRVAAIYNEILEGVDGIDILRPPTNVVHNRYKYVMFLKNCQPKAVEKLLLKKYGIPLAGYVYEEPCHKQPAFQQFDGRDCVHAEHLCSSHICLPLYPRMSDAEARFVAESAARVIDGLC